METHSDIQILSSQELKKLAKVIGEVEKTTRAEIRLMIVKRSAVTGHVHLLLWGLLVSLTLLCLFLPRHAPAFLNLWWFLPSILVTHYVLAALLARVQLIERLFTSHHDLHHQVWARAELEFHRQGLGDTRLHTGVLIFVSLMEHQARVMADKAIADKLPPQALDQVVRTLIHGARTGHWAEKLEQALRECGAYLALHFPAENTSSQELPNTVILGD